MCSKSFIFSSNMRKIVSQISTAAMCAHLLIFQPENPCQIICNMSSFGGNQRGKLTSQIETDAISTCNTADRRNPAPVDR